MKQKRLIPKGQSGWTVYLNPKNWGLSDYNTTEFSEAFAKARQNGDKEFLWRGNRYHTRLIKPESQKQFDQQYNWLKNKISSLTPDDATPSALDSIDARIYSKNKDLELMNSLGPDYYNNLEEYSKRAAQYEQSYLDSIKNKRIQDVKERFKNYNRKNLVVTDEPQKDYNTMGYHDTIKP